MNCQIKLWVGVLFILLTYRVVGQEYSFQHLTTDIGLSQGNVSSIVRDSKGFLWIATENGLNKFDGYSFTAYHHNPKDPFTLANDWIYYIKLDLQNRLWVSTRNGFHLYDRDNDRFSTYKFQGKAAFLNDLFVYDFLFESKSIMWLYCSTGLVKYNLNTLKIENQLEDFANHQLLNGLDVHTIGKDSKGDFWILSRNGCFKVDFSKKRVQKILLFDEKGKELNLETTDFYQDKNGYSWVATNGQGIFILNGDNKIIRRVNTRNSNLTNDNLTFIESDTDHNIWVGTNNGLNVLSAQKVDQYDFSFINLTHEYYDSHSILSNDITTFYQEKEGRIWIGSRAGGADFYDNQIKKFYNLFLNPGSPKSLSHSTSTCFAENEEGEIFMGTDGGGIDVLSKDRKTVTPFSKYALFGKLTAKKVISMAFDSKKRLFVGMWGGGVDIFDFKMHTKIHLKKGTGKLDLTSNEIFSLLADRHGNVWIGTFQHGVNRIDSDLSQVIRLEKSPIINNNASISISQLYEDKRGDIWMTIDPEGICKFDYHTGGLSYFLSLRETQKTLGSFSVLDFFEDRDGRFWIGTRGRGLYLFDRAKNKLITFNLNSKIINQDIFGILEDKNGAIWLSSNCGIYKLKSTGIGNSMSSTFRNYDVKDGLSANQFNLLSAFKSRSGEFFFGSVSGVTYFKPEEIIDNKYKPEVVFTGLYVFNVLSKPNTKDSPLKKDISESQTIVLNDDQSLFSVEFVGMNFTQPLKNQYKCILEGFDKNWRYLGTEHKVTYSNLDPGTYVLKVMASNNDGLWNDKAATLTIRVLPPWWKETWFILLMVLSIIFLVYLVFRWRLRQLKKSNAELEDKVSLRTEEITAQAAHLEDINNELTKSNSTKNRLFSIIAHDLRSPFNGLLGITDYLKDYYQELDDAQRQDMIAKVAKSTRNIYDLLSNLLIWSMAQKDEMKLNPENVNLSLVIEQAILAVKGNLDKKNIVLETDLSDVTLTADNNQIQAIIRNLLSNASKYSQEGGLISISCQETSNDMIEIKVADQGVGMSAEIQEQLFNASHIKSQPGTHNEKGTGLGLMIVYDFVNLHKGSIQVDSKPGLGTTFIIILPKQLDTNNI